MCSRLLEMKDKIIDFLPKTAAVLLLFAAVILLGKYYKLGDETIEGLGLLDIVTGAAKADL